MADFTKLNGYNVKDAGAGRSLSVSGSDLSLKDANGNTLSTVQMSGGGGGVDKYSDLTDVDLYDPVLKDQVPFYEGQPTNKWSQSYIEPRSEIQLDLLRIVSEDKTTLIYDAVSNPTDVSNVVANVNYYLVFGFKLDPTTTPDYCKPIARFMESGRGSEIALLPYANTIYSHITPDNVDISTKECYPIPNIGFTNAVTQKSSSNAYIYKATGVGSANESNNLLGTGSVSGQYVKLHVQKYIKNDGILRVWADYKTKLTSASDISADVLPYVHVSVNLKGYAVPNGVVNFWPRIPLAVDGNNNKYVNYTYSADIQDYLSIT